MPSLVVTLFAAQGPVLRLSVASTGTISVAIGAPGWTKWLFGRFIASSFQVIVFWRLWLALVHVIHMSRYGS